jgi:hypothetical protein
MFGNGWAPRVMRIDCAARIIPVVLAALWTCAVFPRADTDE